MIFGVPGMHCCTLGDPDHDRLQMSEGLKSPRLPLNAGDLLTT